MTQKTYNHEIFHFNCDVLGMLFSNTYKRDIEEALAVAYSRHSIAAERKSTNTTLGRMNGVLYNLTMDIAYRFTSPGYRDWVHYADPVRFKQGLLDYIQPSNYQKLQSNGVTIEDLLFDMLGKPQGFVERAV